MLLSIIIPVSAHENESSWLALVQQLSKLDYCEIIIVGPAIIPTTSSQVHFLHSSSGRAQAMNAAADKAKGQWLWFIHADSQIDDAALQCLLRTISTDKASGLFYFMLHFYSYHKRLQQLMRFNAAGVKFRSRVLKSPFGDQAFCIDKTSFYRSGRYKVDLDYGEDHHLVWQCHLSRIPVTPLAATIQTSARKYKEGGWFNISILHNWLWFKQWLPLFSRYWQQRL